MCSLHKTAEKRIGYRNIAKRVMLRWAHIITDGTDTNAPWLGTARSGALVLTIVRSGREGRRGFCRFCLIALPTCDCISQPQPTRSRCRMAASACITKGENKVQSVCAHHSVFRTLNQQTLSLCSHRQSSRSWQKPSAETKLRKRDSRGV